MRHLFTADEWRHRVTLRESIVDTWRDRAEAWDRAGRLPDEVVRWCADQGLFGAALPDAYRGGGWNAVKTGLMYEAMGSVSASLASLVNVHGMTARTVARWGTERQREQILPALADGTRVAAIAMTEPHAGSDLAQITTTLSERDNALFLDGTKVFITFGELADVFLVFAKRDGAPVACLVDRENPGLSISSMGEVLGLRAACLGRLEFHACEIDPTAVVGRDGFALSVLLPVALEHGRHAVAWMALGMLRTIFTAVSDHALERRAFGRELIDHGQIQSIITGMGTDLEAASHLCLAASRAMDTGDAAATDRVLTAKYFTCGALERHAAQAVQVLASQGVVESGVTARVYRDAKVLNILEGTTQVLERMLAPRLARAARREA